MQELIQGLGLDAKDSLLLVDHALIHKIAGDLDGCLCGALAISGLQEEEVTVLDRELHVLHVLVVVLEALGELHELLIALRKVLCELGDRLRRADAGDDVLALCVDQVLTEDALCAGCGVSREGNARAGGVAHVSEDHGLDVDGSAQLIGNVVHPSVGVGSGVVPGAEDGLDGLHQLNLRILREVLALLLLVELLVARDDVLKILCLQLGVIDIAVALLFLLEDGIEEGLGLPHDDVREHLDESAVGVIGESRVSGLLCEADDGDIVETQVQNRVHHAGHGDRRTGADGDEERIILIAELLAADTLKPCEGIEDLLLGVLVDVLAIVVVVGAGLCGDRESGRDGHAQVRHLGQVCALAAEEGTHPRIALLKLVHSFVHSFSSFDRAGFLSGQSPYVFPSGIP